MKHGATLALGFSLFLIASLAHAQPEQAPAFQWNASVALGGATHGDQGDLWRATHFAGSLHSDLFLGRTSNRSFGFGPTGFVGFSTYSEANIGAGVQILVPIHELLPIAAGLGVYGVDREKQNARTGGFATLSWGLRSFNYHSTYAMAGGLLLEARRDFADRPITTWLASIQIDAAALALPLVWAANAFR